MSNSIFRRFQRYFGTGLLVLVPFTLTAYILVQLFLAIDGLLVGYVNSLANELFGWDVTIPGLGIITLIILITSVGIAARNYFGKRLIELGEFIVSRLPIINRIYQTIQQISNSFFGEKREVFKSAVLFQYPREGIYSIGFFTQDTKGAVQESIPWDVVSVFLPTTPNPTSGFLLFVRKDEVIELDMPVEEALKLVISGGAIVPQKKVVVNSFGKAKVIDTPIE